MPEKVLTDKSNVFRATIVPSSVGMVPTRLLNISLSIVSLCNDPNCVGRVVDTDKELSNEKNWRFCNWPNSVGIVPVREINWPISAQVREESCPNCVTTVPSN